MSSIEKATQDWYNDYYKKKGNDRNDLLRNPGVLFQHFGSEYSLISALREAKGLDPSSSKILDVGCGGGEQSSKILGNRLCAQQSFRH